MTNSILTIDLGAIAHNYNYFCGKVAPGCQVAAVIKADAYGLGMEKVWAALENQGCPFYFVATPDEALRLRALTQKPIGVFNGVAAADVDTYIHHNLLPVLNSLAMIDIWREAAARHAISLPAIIHFDSGMNRLGLGADETALLLKNPDRLKGLNVKIVMSHFACADEEDHMLTPAQYDRFRAIAAQFPQATASLSASSGICRSADYHFGLVRPGVGLYGINPTPEVANPMRPVVTLDAPILQIRRAKKGESVGYAAGHVLQRDTTLATVSIGYADGFLRSLSGRGALYYKGHACPIAGRVSMDLTIVEVSEKLALQPGEMMEVIGPNQTADDLATQAGTIGYEILTSLGSRYRRIYTTTDAKKFKNEKI